MSAVPITTTIVGRLLDTPEPKKSQKGTSFTRLRVVVESPVTPGDWKGEMESTFYSVVAFGSTAENVCASLGKGDRVIVTGRPEHESWTGRDGQLREGEKIVADAVGVELRFESVQVNRSRRGHDR